MQVRQLIAASLLAVATAGAMAQEIDRSETLQARSLAAQQAQRAQRESTQTPTREAVVAQAREAQAGGDIQVGERADTVPVTAAPPHTAWAKWRANRPYAKTWLKGDRRQDPVAVLADRR